MASDSAPQNTWLTDSEFCSQHDDEHDNDDNTDHTDGGSIDNEGEDDYL